MSEMWRRAHELAHLATVTCSPSPSIDWWQVVLGGLWALLAILILVRLAHSGWHR
jgi:hypothetical protein